MSEWQTIDVAALPKYVDTHWSDLGRIRVAKDGGFEYCDRVVLTYTRLIPAPPAERREP
jgi:hypothetical protein